jgi:hypothetical protein
MFEIAIPKPRRNESERLPLVYSMENSVQLALTNFLEEPVKASG